MEWQILFCVALRIAIASNKCSLQTSKIPIEENNPSGISSDQITVTVSDNFDGTFNETALFDTDTVFTIKCKEDGYTFTNGIREVIGVNVTRINTEGEIRVTCTNQYFNPNVWIQTEGESATKTSYRKIYCVPGCTPISDNTIVVDYAKASVSSEDYSPPIMPSADFVSTVSCRSGYTTAETPTGNTAISCAYSDGEAQWSPASDTLLSCYKGCSDIRESVEFGTATADPSTDGASFIVGAEVTFACNGGFELVGWDILTCNANSVWSDKLPECVYLGGNGENKLQFSHILMGYLVHSCLVFLF